MARRVRDDDSCRELWAAVQSVAAVDAHAHNLVAIDSRFPFPRCFSEAEEEALTLAPHSLSFKRSIRDIASLYNCDPSLDGVEAHRRSSGLYSISSKCFEAAKISSVFIDDGIIFDKMYDWEWHKDFVPDVRRILRIEHLAETILNAFDGTQWTLDSFIEIFIARIKSVSDKVVAFKSIAAYRSGLQIDPEVNREAAEGGLIEDIHAGQPVRIKNKCFIDYLFTFSLELAVIFDLPMQIHTGFGDKDLDLRLSNPLFLRAVLEHEKFSKCKLVLLHASYPFSKEASYLASVYPQIYLDFGLAVPKLSVQGMISSVKELLELAPIKKVMFSTDGYAFPETFFLGAKRGRDVVFSVLSEACYDGDLTISDAIEAVKDMFYRNALELYKLNDLLTFDGFKNLGPVSNSSATIESNNGAVFVRIIWVDASGQHRCRGIPSKRFYDVVKTTGVGLAFASMAMTSFSDGPAAGTNLTAVGEIRLVPDLSTKCRIPWTEREEMVLANMQIRPDEAWEYCPRDALRRLAHRLKDEFNLIMNAGFENEFYLLKSLLREGTESWSPYDATPYCSSSGFDAGSPILENVLSALQCLGISVDQLHAESGKGQFEVALGHTDCTLAADNLVFTREAIRAVARKHGVLATFLPKYSLDEIGSGSHVHLSLWENGKNVFMGVESLNPQYGISDIGKMFMAGVFYHLPSILAFIAPHPNSYDRIQPNTWSGAYHCWGRENREAPLRTACPPGVPCKLVSNFELKSFDGCANPHLGLASILAAGIDGLQNKLSLPPPVETNPSEHVGTPLKRLPSRLQESMAALEEDLVLKNLIGEKLVTAVIGVRKAEVDYYEKNKDAYKQLIHRY